MRTAPSQLRKPSYAGPGRRTGPLGAGRTVVQPRLPAQRARRLRGGAAEARGFLTLYEPLAAKSPQHLSTCADARARLAWMLANAFPTNTDMGPPSDHEKRAVATCEQLVVCPAPGPRPRALPARRGAADPRRRGLTRVRGRLCGLRASTSPSVRSPGTASGFARTAPCAWLTVTRPTTRTPANGAPPKRRCPRPPGEPPSGRLRLGTPTTQAVPAEPNTFEAEK